MNNTDCLFQLHCIASYESIRGQSGRRYRDARKERADVRGRGRKRQRERMGKRQRETGS